jgi:hypothetical protein
MMYRMMFKPVSPIEWDAERGNVDCRKGQRRLVGLGFHVRLERDNYVNDVFDSATGNADEAYLTSHECETWELVERYCREYDGVTVV